MKQYVVVFDMEQENAYEACKSVQNLVFKQEEFQNLTAYEVKIKVRAMFIDEFPNVDCDVYDLPSFVQAFNQQEVSTDIQEITIVSII
jgi:hypothetical protein